MDYTELNHNLDALLDGKDWYITTLANAAALIYEALDGINWAGFYLYRNGALELGPFMGRPACTRIEVGRGVCGAAYEKNEPLLVENVHDFPGHIACDSASNSEIVLPLADKYGNLIGVLDIDSPQFGRFTEADGAGLGRSAEIIGSRISDLI